MAGDVNVSLEHLKEVIEGSRPSGTPLYMNGKLSALSVRIKQHVVNLGTTMTEFAKAAGVGRSTVEAYHNRTGLRAKQFLLIAKALGEDPVKLFESLGNNGGDSGAGDAAPELGRPTTSMGYVVVPNFMPGLDLVATEFVFTAARHPE
jgi:hypothetical protein